MKKYSEAELDSLKKSVPMWRILANRIPKFERKNGEFIFRCPWHKNGQERTPSLTVRQDKEGRWLYKCFGCINGGFEDTGDGNVFQFVQRFDHITFDEAVQKVKSESEWEDMSDEVRQTFGEVLEKDSQASSFPVERIAEAERTLAGSAVGKRWLADRGISEATARHFHIGFVQSAAAVTTTHAHLSDGWIVIPYIEGEKIVALKYRSIVEKSFVQKSGMTTTIYNLDAVNSFTDVFVAEGEFDAMVLQQAGFTAVALPSASFNPSPEMRAKLLQANRIYLAGDTDAVGQAAMDKLWIELRDRTSKIAWPQGKDANEYFLTACEGNIEKFRKNVEELATIAREQVVPFVFDMRETIKRRGYIKPLENPRRLRLPWRSEDSWTAIIPGDVMVVSGSDTKVGKSTWIMDILAHNAINFGKVVLNYSAELQPIQYAPRLVSHLTQVDRDSLTEEAYQLAEEALKSAHFYNGYKPGAMYKEVIELLKGAKRQLGADIIVVDTLPFLIRGMKNKYEAEEEAMRMLKDFAVEYQVIIIVVSQPRKSQPGVKNREIIGQDISGSYTQSTDASQVFILHRDRKGLTVEGEPIFSDVTKVKLEYSRESRTYVGKLLFKGSTATFREMIEEESPIATTLPEGVMAL